MKKRTIALFIVTGMVAAVLYRYGMAVSTADIKGVCSNPRTRFACESQGKQIGSMSKNCKADCNDALGAMLKECEFDCTYAPDPEKCMDDCKEKIQAGMDETKCPGHCDKLTKEKEASWRKQYAR